MEILPEVTMGVATPCQLFVGLSYGGENHCESKAWFTRATQMQTMFTQCKCNHKQLASRVHVPLACVAGR